MSPKQEIINNFEKQINTEIEKLDKIPDEHERFVRLDVLYKIFKYLKYFDELEPILQKYFEEKRKRDKWEKEK